MRRALLVAFVAILGCGKPAPASPPSPPAPGASAKRREDDAEAAFQLDAACAAIESAQAAAQKLAPLAGGDAKEALLNVAAMLDSAGASLADHTGAPPPAEGYPAPERKQSLADAEDALQALHDARDILAGLAENAPKEYAKPLAAIQTDADEAIDAVESGLARLSRVPQPSKDAP